MNKPVNKMSLKEIISLLKERENQDNPEMLDFSGCDFSHVTFRGINMKNVDFTGANLTCARFNDCKLSNVIFNKANMSQVEFTYSEIRGSSAAAAEFTDSLIYKTQLVNCDFLKSNFTDSSIVYCPVFYCEFERVNFTRLNLGESIFRECSLKYALFAGVSPETMWELQEMGVYHVVELRSSGASMVAFPANGSWSGVIFFKDLDELHSIPKDVDSFIQDHPSLPSDAVLALKYLEAYKNEHLDYVDVMMDIWG